MQTTKLPSIELEYREGTSDKVYRACIEKSGIGFVVNFAYGRRGSTLNTGSKTSAPVTYDEAHSVYEKLVKSKTAKGYKPVNGSGAATGIGSTVTDREQRDTGLRAQLLNPITEDVAGGYLDDTRWCAQEKFDGKRMLLRKAGAEIVAANRDGLGIGFPQAYAAPLSAVPGPMVIDGESVGETFYAFDVLESAAGDLRGTPYLMRLNVLERMLGGIGGSIVVAETARSATKRAFMHRLKSTGKEGIVFKDLDAEWSAGRPSSGGTAFKLKFWASCSCVVARVNAKRSVALSMGGQPMGNVTIPLNHVIPAEGQVVEIRYLYVTAPGGSLYQPIYLGLRDDVQPEDCTIERQHIKYKAAEDRAA